MPDLIELGTKISALNLYKIVHRSDDLWKNVDHAKSNFELKTMPSYTNEEKSYTSYTVIVFAAFSLNVALSITILC